MKKKILFIMNPISGTASKAAVPSLIDSVLDKELFEYEIRMTERAGHASEIATEAKNNHVDVVVAVGGDGTVKRWPAHWFTPIQPSAFCLAVRATDWQDICCSQ